MNISSGPVKQTGPWAPRGLQGAPALLHRRIPRRESDLPQLHPALALGAGQVPGGRRRLPPLHDAAAVGAHRGQATDGKPKFNLGRSVEAFFGRLRDRVAAAGERGLYVAVMFFEG